MHFNFWGFFYKTNKMYNGKQIIIHNMLFVVFRFVYQ